MSRLLFDQTLVPRTVNRGRRGTVIVSFALHAAALVILIALQFTMNTDGPGVVTPLVAVMASPDLPQPPDRVKPAPATATPAAGAPAEPQITVPLDAPDQITAEAAAPIRQTPAALPGVSLGTASHLPGGVSTMASLGDPPPPPAPRVVHAGGQIAAPARVTYRAPLYPAIAQAARVEGTVVLEATIDQHGVVRDVRVTRSIPLLDRAAVDAVAQWRYRPTRLNDVPVSVILTVRVTFSLRP